MVDAEGGDPEAQRKWGVGVAEASTKAFRQWIVNVACDNLVALFCGHVHFPHRDAFAAGRYQYVTGPGFTGGYRKIMIVP
ncbi:hypothetical protein ACFQI7_01720 [Paenibacillus allorhizosphaerae]|nr:hypothetical protein [Paenibacillus allorhizosphaerae]